MLKMTREELERALTSSRRHVDSLNAQVEAYEKMTEIGGVILEDFGERDTGGAGDTEPEPRTLGYIVSDIERIVGRIEGLLLEKAQTPDPDTVTGLIAANRQAVDLVAELGKEIKAIKAVTVHQTSRIIALEEQVKENTAAIADIDQKVNRRINDVRDMVAHNAAPTEPEPKPEPMKRTGKLSPKPKAETNGRAVGAKVGNSKLSETKVRSIRKRRLAGASYAELGREHKVDPMTIRLVCERRTWRHVK